MGKSSKRKSTGKKVGKQERAVHLKNVAIYRETMSTLDKKLQSFDICRTREHLEVLEEQLQLTLGIEESYTIVNRHHAYKFELSGVCSVLLFDQIRLRNYVQASQAYDNMIEYSFVQEFESCVQPFSNLFLLWTERANGDRKDTVENIIERKRRLDKITQDSIDIIHKRGARGAMRLLFLQKTLTELNRCSDQLFEVVESISLAVSKKVGNHRYTTQWLLLARTFLVYSYVDELRSSRQFNKQAFLSKVRKIRWKSHLHLLAGTGYLAYSLLHFYIFINEKEKHSLEAANEIEDECIVPLEKYINFRSKDSQNVCYTCREEDTQDHESFVCQGCRVISYCCRDHQRLNHFHHEETGSRGLGHKQLCPLFKAYRRKRGNTDTSKEGHLDRKFQRACMRFLRGTLHARTQTE
ncbi:predicted protein [Chaetoceros tenuissimus]|uniref:MYND-type domain-containing protein n=1 Tax=Chaetoceros tenuissimus TaxID=426638 RepID=A0AAD3D2H3_9STRA|nr:predicted protein [Chaetoceros tenuissimus]